LAEGSDTEGQIEEKQGGIRTGAPALGGSSKRSQTCDLDSIARRPTEEKTKTVLEAWLPNAASLLLSREGQARGKGQWKDIG